MTLLLDPAARWVPDYYPVDSARQRAGGRLEVRMRVADPRWLQRFLLRLTPHVRVVEPAEYADAYRATLAATLRLYSGLSPGP
ncbi:MAG: WYL domain-containing protein [Nocardioides sp.]